MGAKFFGAAVKRLEDPALLTGRGQYTDDLSAPRIPVGLFDLRQLALDLRQQKSVGAEDRTRGLA